jgi:hypothetical protein
MKRLLQTLLLCSAVTSLLAAGTGCGVKEYFNCRSICEKKKQCGTDSSYDVGACIDRCSDSANSSEEYARKVNTCKECVDPISCNDPKLVGCFGNCPDL